MTRRRGVLVLATATATAAAIGSVAHAAGPAGAVNVTTLIVVLAGLYLSLRTLRRRLGPWTGIAATSVGWGVLSGALAALAAHCPARYGAVAPGRCTSAELAEFVMVGMLAPVAVCVLFLPPVYLLRAGRALHAHRKSTRS